MSTTISAGSSATVELGPWATLTMVVDGTASLAFTSEGQNIHSDFSVTKAQSKTYGPYGVPMSVSIRAVDRVLTYTVGGRPSVYLNDDGTALVDGAGNNFAPNTTRSITAVGTYTGTGSSQNINVGFVPDLVFVKAATAATQLVWATRYGWIGRCWPMMNLPSIGSGILINDDGTFNLSVDTDVNGSAVVYEYFAFKDNGRGNIVVSDHAGNNLAENILRYATGAKLKAALFKRDNTNYAVLALKDAAAYRVDGAASNCPATINDDGTITVGQGGDINIWSGSSGEACQFVGFADGAESIYVSTYTGNASSGRVIQTPFSGVEAVLVFPRGASGVDGAFWSSRLAASECLAIAATSKATVGAQAITAVTGGRVSLGSGDRCNKVGIEYVVIAFRKQTQAAVLVNEGFNRPMRSTKHIVLPASTYINCGTDNSLKIDGAISLEWVGSHFFTTTSGMTQPGTNNSDNSKQLPLIWRSDGADAVAGSLSYGLQLQRAQVGGSGPPLGVVVTNIYDLDQTHAIDTSQPWQSGISPPMRTLFHVLATHNGSGFWRIYLNGVLVKERNHSMLNAVVPRPNIQSGSGHTLCIGARKIASTPTMFNYIRTFMGARIWARELSRAEVAKSYNSWFSDNAIVAPNDFIEEWLASSASGTTLPATRNAANNGTFVGASILIEGT